MSLKNRFLLTPLLFLGAFAILAVVPGGGRTQDAKDKPAKDDKDGAKNPPHVALGALRKYTGYTRPGIPGDRLNADKPRLAPAAPQDAIDEEALGGSIY